MNPKKLRIFPIAKTELRGYNLLAAKTPIRNNSTQIPTNKKNRNFAIEAAAPAIPVNPSNPAINAMTRNISAHLSM